MPDQNIQDKENKKSAPAGFPQDNDRIIVIGASIGGFEAFKKIIQGLPSDFAIPIFITWHTSPDVWGVLPQVLNRENTIPAAHAYDQELIKPNRIYIAPPDHHLLIKKGFMRTTHGPKENCFRPAVDPLFRSAAYTYGNRVIGIILSGGLDDGVAGLWAVKYYGGVCIVQDPMDAEVPSMPENAIRQVKVDHIVSVSEIPELLVRLSKESITENNPVMKDDCTKKEIDIAAEKPGIRDGILKFGHLSPYACPECHGVLSQLRDDTIVRYRCHTGHAYSADVLMAEITEKIEDNLYGAVRGMDESIMLLNQLGDHSAESNQPKLAALYFKKAKEADDRSRLIRRAIFSHEQLTKEAVRKEAENEDTHV